MMLSLDFEQMLTKEMLLCESNEKNCRLLRLIYEIMGSDWKPMFETLNMYILVAVVTVFACSCCWAYDKFRKKRQGNDSHKGMNINFFSTKHQGICNHYFKI